MWIGGCLQITWDALFNIPRVSSYADCRQTIE